MLWWSEIEAGFTRDRILTINKFLVVSQFETAEAVSPWFDVVYAHDLRACVKISELIPRPLLFQKRRGGLCVDSRSPSLPKRGLPAAGRDFG
jgi:hypothetical protein